MTRTAFFWLVVSIVSFILLLGDLSFNDSSFWRVALFFLLSVFGFIAWVSHDEAKYSGDLRVTKKV
jgi:TctA family transporter